ncbi:flagellar assembly protein FliH [Bacillus solimangrovi]|uniref:Flagellar assembly protein FliH n=1 Tax=Bacillus solimangrovi TaxID=1305675 RepID=A0A1E5LAZ7_9BACI|nr:flagellar assembly protein FliH [Bacillus solimangrovi]OEH91260.1 flagellar assembly protein FliH [Bacillus solimangrovi]
MTSLSKLTESKKVKTVPIISEKKRLIELRPFSTELNEVNEQDESVDKIDSQILLEKEQEAKQLVEEAQHEAERIHREAEQYSEQILQQVEQERLNWENERQQFIEQARDEGYTAGFEQGSDEAHQQYTDIIDEAKRIVETSKEDYAKHLVESESTILLLAMKVAEKILDIKLTEQPEVFLNLVRRVIKEVKEHQNIQIHVHPSNFEFVVSQKEELLALFTHPTAELYIFPDDDLQEYQCKIESSFGRIDASVDSQLNEIKIKLLQILEEENGNEGN